MDGVTETPTEEIGLPMLLPTPSRGPQALALAHLAPLEKRLHESSELSLDHEDAPSPTVKVERLGLADDAGDSLAASTQPGLDRLSERADVGDTTQTGPILPSFTALCRSIGMNDTPSSTNTTPRHILVRRQQLQSRHLASQSSSDDASRPVYRRPANTVLPAQHPHRTLKKVEDILRGCVTTTKPNALRLAIANDLHKFLGGYLSAAEKDLADIRTVVKAYVTSQFTCKEDTPVFFKATGRSFDQVYTKKDQDRAVYYWALFQGEKSFLTICWDLFLSPVALLSWIVRRVGYNLL
jgi:hypothetical protein